tara:strand:- start:179 stop:3097 length:2919 start_codon:yes stop_codon:yes gene_type:complete
MEAVARATAVPLPEYTYVSDLNFQLLSVSTSDLQVKPLLEESPTSETLASNQFMNLVPPEETENFEKRKLLVFLFGNELTTGTPVCVRVEGFRPYLYYDATKISMNTLREQLATALKIRDERDLIIRLEKKKMTFGFHSDPNNPTEHQKFPVFRVSFTSRSKWRGAIWKASEKEPKVTRLPPPWESDKDISSMFVEALGITPSSFFKIKTGKRVTKSKISRCDLEFIVQSPRNLEPVQLDAIAPFLTCNFDIECYSASGKFPEAENVEDEVRIIGLDFWRVGQPMESAVSAMLVVGECDPVEGCIVISFDSEKELINGFRDLVAVYVDPDFVFGFNRFGFDDKYIEDRAAMLGADRFFYNGRIQTVKTITKLKNLESSALAQNEMYAINWEGRINFDVFNYVKANYNLSYYGLSPVGRHFVGEEKVDLPYQKMFHCIRPGAAPEEVALAAAYCFGDVVLPRKILNAIQVIPSLVEMSRVTETFIYQLVFNGQSKKVFQQITKFAHAAGHVVNPVERPRNVGGYTGAIVLPPLKGYYTDPIGCLDFASLYPSIMITHNLCYSTFVKKGTSHVDGVEYETHKVSENEEYTFALGVKGILTEMLKSILAARKKAKKQMAEATDPLTKAIFNGRQLALKISANSIYGFCGAEMLGKYPLAAIAKCTTLNGRILIEETKRMAIELFKPFIAEVIYGDTDSIFVRLRREDGTLISVEEAFRAGEVVADKISNSFRGVIELEMEKVYDGFVLIAKKRYFGAMFEEKKGKVVYTKTDAKGVELVRRDNCAVVKKLYEKIINALIFEKSAEIAISSIRESLKEIVDDTVAYEDYVITKMLRKKESYKNPMQETVVLADKMVKRGVGGEMPQVGDRLAYVIKYDPRATHICHKAETLGHLRRNNLKLDRNYYILNKIKNPVLTIFEAFDQHKKEVTKLLDDAMIHVRMQLEHQSPIYHFFKKRPALPDDEGGSGSAASRQRV